MDKKELKKILVGLSISTLLAGTGAIGIGHVDAQGGWTGSKGAGTGTEGKQKSEGMMQEEQGGSSCTGSKAGLSEYGLADIDQGKMLFNDPSLGGSMNDKSCNSCHPGGKGLENVSGNISETINTCIKNALAGEGLDVDSEDMKNIVAYIKSLNK